MPLWELPQTALPQGLNSESGDGADGIEAALQFQVNPGAVDGYASLSGSQALKGAIATMLELDASKVTVLSLKAASTVPRKEGLRRLQSSSAAAPAGGAITGVLQTDFVVLCGTEDERHAATRKVEDLAWDTEAQQRFAEALTAGSLDKLAMQASMLDRQWSRAAATSGKDGDSWVVGSHAEDSPDRLVRADVLGLGIPTVPLLATVAGLLLAVCVCVACNADRRHLFRRRREDKDSRGANEAQPFLGGSFAEDSDGGEVQKGDVPSGVAGFNPRDFDAEKYMSHSPEKHHHKRSHHHEVKPGSGYDLLVGNHPHLGSRQQHHLHRGH